MQKSALQQKDNKTEFPALNENLNSIKKGRCKLHRPFKKFVI
jgi:hypothetical protein